AGPAGPAGGQTGCPLVLPLGRVERRHSGILSGAVGGVGPVPPDPAASDASAARLGPGRAPASLDQGQPGERDQRESGEDQEARRGAAGVLLGEPQRGGEVEPDRKSTRLNSSHVKISYAVFCLKKK